GAHRPRYRLPGGPEWVLCAEPSSNRAVYHAAMPIGPALSCENLAKRYGAVIAVHGLSLTVHRGECFGLLGPNGAGKTTTIEILEGLTGPDSGDVEVLGMRWSTQGERLRQRLGIQLQETQLSDTL